MAVQSDDLKLLFNYVAERNTSEVDKQLFLWLARFFEVHNQYELSLDYYLKAGANKEYLRLLYIDGQWALAAYSAENSSFKAKDDQRQLNASLLQNNSMQSLNFATNTM